MDYRKEGKKFAKAEKVRKKRERIERTALFWFFFTVQYDHYKLFQLSLMTPFQRIDAAYSQPPIFVGYWAKYLTRKAARNEPVVFYRCHDGYWKSVWGNLKLQLRLLFMKARNYRETIRNRKSIVQAVEQLKKTRA